MDTIASMHLHASYNLKGKCHHFRGKDIKLGNICFMLWKILETLENVYRGASREGQVGKGKEE